MRQEFTKRVKLLAFERSKGLCDLCTARLFPGNTEYHHKRECTFEGEATLENCSCICRTCHRQITNKQAAVIAKSNRVRNRNIGLKKDRTIRAWRKFNGTPVFAPRER